MVIHGLTGNMLQIGMLQLQKAKLEIENMVIWGLTDNMLNWYAPGAEKKRGLTAEPSHPCKDSQQRIALQVVLSLKLHIAANCCKMVADL